MNSFPKIIYGTAWLVEPLWDSNSLLSLFIRTYVRAVLQSHARKLKYLTLLGLLLPHAQEDREDHRSRCESGATRFQSNQYRLSTEALPVSSMTC